MTTAQQTCLFKTYKMRESVRKVWKRKEKITTSQWAEKYRRVTMGAHVGPWRNDISPYLSFIMDIWGLAHVREVSIAKSPQTGGTEIIFNCEGFSMERDPSTAMIVMPDQSKARDWAKDRIIPMIKESPQLAALQTDNPDDMASQRICLNNGERLFMAWSNSKSALSGWSIKRIYFDETDKYPSFVGNETDPIRLGEKRTRTFRYTYKIMKVSTPTRQDAPIWKAVKQSDVEYRYHVLCPDCAHEQVMGIDNLVYPKDKTAETIEREHLAEYVCAGCGVLWSDRKRDMAVRSGSWKKVKGYDIERPVRVAFHLPSWISPDVSLSEIAATHLKSKTDRGALIDLYNDYLAEPYIEKQSERKEDEILKLTDDRPRGLVPKDISILLFIIDTQKRGFYYEVVAIGWGDKLETWQVREGYVESFKGLEDILYDSEYKDIDGQHYVIQAGIIDSGGGTGTVPKHSRTAEVYDFCRRNPIVRPLKGYQTMTMPWATTKIDFYPGTKTPIPGGLSLYRANVTYYKDLLATKLTINPLDPGAWHLHSECTMDYAQQMCSEYRGDRGRWQCPEGKANHYWDIGVYRLVLADVLQIKFWKRPEEEETYTANTEKKPKIKSGRW